MYNISCLPEKYVNSGWQVQALFPVDFPVPTTVPGFYPCCSVAQSCPTLWDPVRLSLSSLSSWVFSNSCPLNWWCRTTISASIVPFSSCPQSFWASGSLPMGQLFTSGGQNIEDSASTSTLLMNSLGFFPLGLTGLISLLVKDSPESSPAPHFESINSLVLSLLYGPTLTSVHDYWKSHSFDYTDLCRQSDVSPFLYAV